MTEISVSASNRKRKKSKLEFDMGCIRMILTDAKEKGELSKQIPVETVWMRSITHEGIVTVSTADPQLWKELAQANIASLHEV